jgi:hypothetical protein
MREAERDIEPVKDFHPHLFSDTAIEEQVGLSFTFNMTKGA